MSSSQIEYSEKYANEENECRWVVWGESRHGAAMAPAAARIICPPGALMWYFDGVGWFILPVCQEGVAGVASTFGSWVVAFLSGQ